MSGKSRSVISTERSNHGLRVALDLGQIEVRPGAATSNLLVDGAGQIRYRQ